MAFLSNAISRYFHPSPPRVEYAVRVQGEFFRLQQMEDQTLIEELWEVQEAANYWQKNGPRMTQIFLYLGLFFREVVAQSPLFMVTFTGVVYGVFRLTERRIHLLQDKEARLIQKFKGISLHNLKKIEPEGDSKIRSVSLDIWRFKPPTLAEMMQQRGREGGEVRLQSIPVDNLPLVVGRAAQGPRSAYQPGRMPRSPVPEEGEGFPVASPVEPAGEAKKVQ